MPILYLFLFLFNFNIFILIDEFNNSSQNVQYAEEQLGMFLFDFG